MKTLTRAILTVYDADQLTKKEKARISRWLRMHARDIVNPKYSYSKVFKGRILRTVED